MQFRKSMFLLSLFFGFSLMAMDGQDLKTQSEQYFRHKENNFNCSKWDKAVKNSQDQDCLEIWVPNHQEYIDQYREHGVVLMQEINQSNDWIRAQLPPGWKMQRRSVEQGSYRVVMDEQRQTKFGINHYLLQTGDCIKQESQVTFYDDQKRVKKKVF